MCGVFGFTSDSKTFGLLGVANPPAQIDQYSSFKITPRSTIITISKNSPNQAIPRIWWLAPPWADDPYKV